MPFITSSALSYYLINNEILVKQIPFIYVCLFSPIWSIFLTFGICTTTFTCLAGGYLFGWKILIIILPTYLISQTLGFWIANKIDKNLILILKEKKKYPHFLDNVTENESKVVFFSRISPVLPFALMNMVLGILKVNFKKFTFAGLAGMLPRTLFSIWLGCQVQNFLQTKENSLSFWFASISIIVSFYFLIKALKPKEIVINKNN